MTFRVTCPECKTQSIVTDSRDLSKDVKGAFVKDLYCYCKNTECCASFIVNVSFTQYLNPPRQTTAELAVSYLNSLPSEERQQALELVQP